MSLLSLNKKVIRAGIAVCLLLLVFCSLTYLNIFSFHENHYIIEPLNFLLLTGLSLFLIVRSKTVSVTLFELFYGLFILYASARSFLSGPVDTSSLFTLLFPAILYAGLKSFFSQNKIFSQASVLCWIMTLPLLFYIAVFIYTYTRSAAAIDSLFIPNKSIFSILLASQLVFVLPLSFRYIKNKKKYSVLLPGLFTAIILLGVLLMVMTGGRSGILGFFLASVYLLYQYIPRKQIRQLILFSGLATFALLFFMLLFSKTASSGGRFLIYKVSVNLFGYNWLWGAGIGQFQAKYNEYQADYFSSAGIDGKEALLADNTFYAFNDYWQLLIENGIAGFLLWSFSIVLLIRQTSSIKMNPDNKPLVLAAIASLLCISTAAFFSYPLQALPVVVQVTICLAIINAIDVASAGKIDRPVIARWVVKPFLIIISVLLITHSCFFLHYKTQSHQAFRLSTAGYKTKAIEKYEALSHSYISDGNTLFSHAKALYHSHQLDEAKQILYKARQYYCSHEIYKLAAKIEMELKNYTAAERNYKRAVCMVPNRMLSRYELLAYYLTIKDTTNAIYWASSIQEMKVKVPSPATTYTKQMARKALQQLQ